MCAIPCTSDHDMNAWTHTRSGIDSMHHYYITVDSFTLTHPAFGCTLNDARYTLHSEGRYTHRLKCNRNWEPLRCYTGNFCMSKRRDSNTKFFVRILRSTRTFTKHVTAWKISVLCGIWEFHLTVKCELTLMSNVEVKRPNKLSIKY